MCAWLAEPYWCGTPGLCWGFATPPLLKPCDLIGRRTGSWGLALQVLCSPTAPAPVPLYGPENPHWPGQASLECSLHGQLH